MALKDFYCKKPNFQCFSGSILNPNIFQLILLCNNVIYNTTVGIYSTKVPHPVGGLFYFTFVRLRKYIIVFSVNKLCRHIVDRDSKLYPQPTHKFKKKIHNICI